MTMPKTPELQALFQAVLSLKTQSECEAFFEDLCTVKETQAMAQRLEVARQLTAGRNYVEVCNDTGASSATISRVNRCLLYGEGGYRTVLERLEEQNADQ